MRKIIFLLFTILAAWQVKAADKVRFVAEAADVVVSGDQVRLVFTVNSQDIKDFRAPSIKGFDVLMGPSRSQQSSIQIINGKRTSNSSTAFTYILLAGNPGTYTIPAASVEVMERKSFPMPFPSRCFRRTRPRGIVATTEEAVLLLHAARQQVAVSQPMICLSRLQPARPPYTSRKPFC